VGDSISINDPGDLGKLIFGEVISITSPTNVIANFTNSPGLTIGESSTTGTIYIHKSKVQTWPTFAGGFSNFATAESHWDICHNSYLQTLVVRPLPAPFGECKWYIDEANFTGDPGDQSTPHKYLSELVAWATRQKETVQFRIPITPANAVLELLDFVTFRDQKFTADELREGYITKIKTDPKSDTIILELTLIPADIESVTDCLIVESGINTDTIVESGGESDTIVESGTC